MPHSARISVIPAASTISAASRTWCRPQAGPFARSHGKQSRPADKRTNKSSKSGGKTALFVVLGLVAIVYIVGVVAFSQVAYPNTTIAGVDISLSNASSAATKVNSAWKHYKLTVSGDDFSWTYQPESDEPIVDGEEAAHEIISKNEPLLWPSRLIASLGGKTDSATKKDSGRLGPGRRPVHALRCL